MENYDTFSAHNLSIPVKSLATNTLLLLAITINASAENETTAICLDSAEVATIIAIASYKPVALTHDGLFEKSILLFTN